MQLGRKSPLVFLGNRFVHRRALSGIKAGGAEMSIHTPGEWRYFRNANNFYTVYPAKFDMHPNFQKVVIAEVCTRDLARLITASPEMKIALISAVGALRATEVFMFGLGLKTDDLNTIIRVIDELFCIKIQSSESFSCCRRCFCGCCVSLLLSFTLLHS